MKYLIVNGVDFGASHGINRGIVEAHRRGILTSASLMVNMPATGAAVALSRSLPHLSVGMHVNFGIEPGKDAGGANVTGGANVADNCRAELYRQFYRFQELV